MTRNIHPADELAEIRAEIRRLKAREAALRKGFLSGHTPTAGAFHRVRVVTSQRKVLLRDKLPLHITSDPQYFEMRKTPSIRVTTRQNAEPGVGGDLDVIERF